MKFVFFFSSQKGQIYWSEVRRHIIYQFLPHQFSLRTAGLKKQYLTDIRSVWNNLVVLIDHNSLWITKRLTFQHNKADITEQFKWESLLNQRSCLPHRMEGYFSMKYRCRSLPEERQLTSQIWQVDWIASTKEHRTMQPSWHYLLEDSASNTPLVYPYQK